MDVNTLNAELNPICHLVALLEAHHFLHVSRIRVKMFDIIGVFIVVVTSEGPRLILKFWIIHESLKIRG